jgi:hypothetical protein
MLRYLTHLGFALLAPYAVIVAFVAIAQPGLQTAGNLIFAVAPILSMVLCILVFWADRD